MTLEFVNSEKIKKPYAQFMGAARIKYLWRCGHDQIVDHARTPPHGEENTCDSARAQWIAFMWGQANRAAHPCPQCAKARAEARAKTAGRKHRPAASKKKKRSGRGQKTSGRVRSS